MNNAAYNLNFSSVGQDVIIWPLAKIVSPEVVSIGNSVIIDDYVFLMGGDKTSIGSFIHIASFTSVTGGGRLIMENFSGLSSGTRVYTGNEDYNGGCLTNPSVPFPYRIAERSFVHIKKHVIVGANSVILPGVTIGEGTAIGANSLVTKDCKPWTIYFGSPAKPMRRRPREKILELENLLLKELYDNHGNYIPKHKRKRIKSS